MLHTIILPPILRRIRKNADLKAKLCAANGIEDAAIRAQLRPQPNGLPHASKLALKHNLDIISDSMEVDVNDIIAIIEYGITDEIYKPK